VSSLIKIQSRSNPCPNHIDAFGSFGSVGSFWLGRLGRLSRLFWLNWPVGVQAGRQVGRLIGYVEPIVGGLPVGIGEWDSVSRGRHGLNGFQSPSDIM